MPDNDPEDTLDEDWPILFFDGTNYYSESEIAWNYGIYDWTVLNWNLTSEAKKAFLSEQKLKAAEDLIYEMKLKAQEIRQGFIDVIGELYH